MALSSAITVSRGAAAFFALVVAACAPAAVSPCPAAEAAADAAEVVVVGTEHRGHIVKPGYPMHHLEALLRAYHPELVLVEIRPEQLAAGRLEDGPLEMSYMAIVARELRIPVEGIDWFRDSDLSAPALPNDAEGEREYERDFAGQAERFDSYASFEELNSAERARAVIDMRNAQVRFGLSDALSWERRQAWFHARAIGAIAAHRSRRTMAFVGFAHRPELESWLASSKLRTRLPTDLHVPIVDGPVPQSVLDFWAVAADRIDQRAQTQDTEMRERLTKKAAAWRAAVRLRGRCCDGP